MKKVSEQEIIRINKLQKLKKLGINPYPSKEYIINNNIKNIISYYKENEYVSIAGRIMKIRIMGKSSFAEIKDNTGIIQLYINQCNIINDKKQILYNEIFKKLIDIGDILGIQGNIFKTKNGEITIRVTNIKLLAKSICPLPQVKIDNKGIIHNAFTDIEQRYRMRYLDLIINPNVKIIFEKRNKIIQFIRDYFNKKKYLEVETPILQSIPGGALAKPFITHHNSLNTSFYLRVSNELYLKRLIIGGFKAVYEFAKDFRNEGMDRIHNPEFTILELYVAYKDYYWMMKFTELLIYNLCLYINGKYKFKVNKYLINFKPPYQRINIYDSIKKYTGFNISNMDEKSIKNICIKLNINIKEKIGKGKLIESIFSEKCEKNYIQPTFITNFPVEMSPLSKLHRDDKNLTERFELIINGQEIANAYSELNDPIDQLNRFKIQQKLFNNNQYSKLIDYDFINALKFGMPPTAGIGIGIDRLTMIMTNQSSIQEVLFFPQMKNNNKL